MSQAPRLDDSCTRFDVQEDPSHAQDYEEPPQEVKDARASRKE